MLRRMRWTALLLSLTLVFGVTACGGGADETDGTGTETGTEVDLEDLAGRLLDEVSWDSDMSLLPDNLFSRRYQFDPELMEESVLYTSSGYTPEEIALVKLNSAADAVTVQSDFERRIEEQRDNFSDYEVEQLPKLDQPYLTIKGTYVVFVVSGDTAQVSGIVDEAFSGAQGD